MAYYNVFVILLLMEEETKVMLAAKSQTCVCDFAANITFVL